MYRIVKSSLVLGALTALVLVLGVANGASSRFKPCPTGYGLTPAVGYEEFDTNLSGNVCVWRGKKDPPGGLSVVEDQLVRVG